MVLSQRPHVLARADPDGPGAARTLLRPVLHTRFRSTACAEVDLSRVSPNNLLILIGMALIVILGWWWAIRTVREQLAEGKTLADLRALSPDAFEEWVAARFRDQGYTTRLTGTTGDHGI